MDRGGIANVSHEDWSKAWRDWARARKRGKMAQFIIEKLEEGKQARWLDISRGKFELSEWHAIADEWYKAKQNRNSDESDAPCMLRKGLPRAFPGLSELKTESMKEGTQYRSRVFQSSEDLIQEVAHHLPASCRSKFTMYPLGNGQNQLASNGHLFPNTSSVSVQQPQPQYMMSTQNQAGVGFLPNGYFSVPGSGTSSPHYDEDLSMLDGSDSWLGFDSSLNASSVEASPLYVDQQLSPYSSYNDASYKISSPYAADKGSPFSSASGLTVPIAKSDDVEWSSPHNSAYGSPLAVSPGRNRSPKPSSASIICGPMSQPSSASINPGLCQDYPPAVSQGYNEGYSSNFTQEFLTSGGQELLQIQAIPSKSPLEGGGQLALLSMNREMPTGKKTLVFQSTTKPEFTTTVDCCEVNPMALMALIPKHAIPEAVVLQVICNGQLIASTEFLYYADAAYNSEMFYQFLCQNLPRYYNQSDVFGGAGQPSGGASREPTYGAGCYGNNIPTSMYGILVGSCRMGLESLVYATLTLPAMRNISLEQLEKAREVALQHERHFLARVLSELIAAKQVEHRGEGASNGVYSSRISELQREGGMPEEEACKVLEQLVKAIKTSSVTVQVQGDQEVPRTPFTPCTPCDVREDVSVKVQDVSVKVEGADVKVDEESRILKPPSPHKLLRQSKSIRDDDGGESADLVPPMPAEITSSSEEGFGRRSNLSRQGKPRNTGGQSKVLVATTSDADSAVSMSFDNDDTSTSDIVSHTLSSLSTGSVSESDKFPGAVNVSLDTEMAALLADSLRFEHSYIVLEDFPSEEKKLRSGDRIVAVGDSEVGRLNTEEFEKLIRTETAKGATVLKVLSQPQTQPERSRVFSPSLPLGVEDKFFSQKFGESSIATKVANLLTMKSSRVKRVVTIPRTSEGFGFKVLGGNAVGLFVSETLRKELKSGDQILEINGCPTRGMTHYEATHLLRQSSDQLMMTVVDNYSRYTALKDQVECDSFYLKSRTAYTSEDSKETKVVPGSLLHVVNTFLYREHWLAWSVDQTGLESDLGKIRVPRTISQSGEYERVELRPVPYLRPLVLVGATDKMIVKELNTEEDFTECTRLRDVDKVCIPGSSQRGVMTVNQPNDIAAIRHFNPIVIHTVLRPSTSQETSIKMFYDIISSTVEADSISALVTAVKENVKILQQQPVWFPWAPTI